MPGKPLLIVALSGSVLAAASPEGASGVDPQAAARFVEEGTRHYRERRYFQAIEAFDKALAHADEASAREVRKHLASAHGGLGLEYFNAGESRLAEDYFRKGLGYADNYYSNFGLGYLYFLRMDDEESLKHLRKALEQRPDFAGTHKLLALIDYREGRSAGALSRIAQARLLDPEDGESRALERRWRVESSFSSRFTELPTKHFLVRVDPRVSESARQKLFLELERAYREIGDGLGVWPDRRTVVLLFTEKSFHDATGSYHWVGGMYDGQLKMPVPLGELTDRESVARVREVIRHEYAHVLVRHLASECPVWLNEGIAQHFEGAVDRGELASRLVEGRERRVPFQKVHPRLWAVEDVELARWSYLQGLGFVEYLVDRYHEFRLRLLLAALAEEHSLARAFQRTYGKSLEDLEEAWWASVVAGADRGGR